MPKVNIQSDSKYSAQETYEKVKTLLDNDKDLKKLDPNYACEFNDSDMSGQAKSSLFKANMTVSDNPVSVEIIVDLPFHLALAKGMVRKTLEKKLSRELG